MNQQQELQALRQEVLALRQENQRLRDRSSREFLERAILDDELSQNIAGSMDRFFPETPTPWYICVLFFGGTPGAGEFPGEDPLIQTESLYREALKSFGQPRFLDASGVVACLINLSPASIERRETELLPELVRILSHVYDSARETANTAYITVSLPSRIEEGGPKPLFRGALSASERRTSSSPSVCVEQPDTVPRRKDRVQLLALEQGFWRQIQMRTFFDAAVTLDQMLQLHEQERGVLDKTLASVFSRMELVLNVTVSDSGDSAGHIPEAERLLSKLSRVRSHQEMREVAFDILATLEDQVCTPPDTRNRKMPAIEQYIQIHYGDPDLCANSIAESFKISPSYLSRIFKTDMNMGIVDYIHRVRIEAAKQLLTETDMTTDAVASAVGFSSRVVLNRVFKKQIGTTPGGYRAAMG